MRPEGPAPRRRLGWLAVAGVVVAGAVAVTVGPGGGGAEEDQAVRTMTRVTAPPRDWANECDNDGDSRGAPTAELPDDLRLFPGYIPDGLVLDQTGASVWPDHLGCHHGSDALVLADLDGDRIVRSIHVAGPSYRPPSAEKSSMMREEAVTVRGVPGTWQTFGDPVEWGNLAGADPEGGQWTIRGAKTRAEAVELADGLEIDLDTTGPPVTADDLPDGLEVLWQRPEQEGAGLDDEWSWFVAIKDPKQRNEPPGMVPPTTGPPTAPETGVPVAPVMPPYSGPAISIGVTRMATAGTAFGNHHTGQLTKVRGRPGLWFSEPTGMTFLAWDEEYGIQVTVSGSASLEELRKVAESLELVDADDRRLTPANP